MHTPAIARRWPRWSTRHTVLGLGALYLAHLANCFVPFLRFTLDALNHLALLALNLLPLAICVVALKLDRAPLKAAMLVVMLPVGLVSLGESFFSKYATYPQARINIKWGHALPVVEQNLGGQYEFTIRHEVPIGPGVCLVREWPTDLGGYVSRMYPTPARPQLMAVAPYHMKLVIDRNLKPRREEAAMVQLKPFLYF